MMTAAENWRQRAQEARDLAAWVQDREVRQALLRIAEDYADKAREVDTDQSADGPSRAPGRRSRGGASMRDTLAGAERAERGPAERYR